MDRKFLEARPKINPQIDFRSIEKGLSPLQSQILKFVNGITTVEIIINAVGASKKEAGEAIRELIRTKCLFLGDKVSKDLVPGAKKNSGPVGAPQSILPSCDDSGSTQKSEPSVTSAEQMSSVPAFTGEKVSDFLLQVYEKQETRSYRLVGEIRPMILDFVEGELQRIVPTPVDPSNLLGVALVKHMGMGTICLKRSIEERKTKGTLQGESLIEMGATTPKNVLQMLQGQAEFRLVELMRSERITCTAHQPRLTQRLKVRLPWRPALANACWKSQSDEWIDNWQKKFSTFTVNKFPTKRPGDAGLGKQFTEFWTKSIINGNSLEFYGGLRVFEPQLIYRMIFTFYCLGIVELVNPV